MQLDGRTLDGRRLETRVCVVGAGPCGLALAHRLAGAGIATIVLESGGDVHEPRTERLSAGRTHGDSYAGLERTRRRAVGGTATSWNTPVGGEPGAKYVPLDRSDLEAWPLDWAELARWYERAQKLCALGPFDYTAAAHAGPDAPALELAGDLESGVYQLGRAAVFTRNLPEVLRRSEHVTLCDHATLVGLSPRQRVEAGTVATLTGARFEVRADTWVLAGGAVENARILLLGGIGGEHVGRCFMEHPRDSSLVLLAGKDFDDRFYTAHDGVAGAQVLGRLAPTEEAKRRHRLPSASLTFLPYLPRRPFRAGRHPPLAGRTPRGGMAYLLLLNVEQRPEPGNRIVLGTRRDPLGLPQAELHWRFGADDLAALERLRALVAAELESAGLGRVVRTRQERPDPNAHNHAGTTRMSADPAAGVVDPSCRVHGTENVYAVGGSVLPSAGYANPTLTAVALALRLAEHLTG